MYPKRVLNISHLDGYYPVSRSILHFRSYERLQSLARGEVSSHGRNYWSRGLQQIFSIVIVVETMVQIDGLEYLSTVSSTVQH
jgi:hypothetical protein